MECLRDMVKGLSELKILAGSSGKRPLAVSSRRT